MDIVPHSKEIDLKMHNSDVPIRIRKLKDITPAILNNSALPDHTVCEAVSIANGNLRPSSAHTSIKREYSIYRGKIQPALICHKRKQGVGMGGGRGDYEKKHHSPEIVGQVCRFPTYSRLFPLDGQVLCQVPIELNFTRLPV